MTSSRRAIVYLLLPAIGLAIALVATPRRHREEDLSEQLRLKDPKLRRTVRFHEMAEAAATPLRRVNREGLPIDIEIDPSTLELMSVIPNRALYKRRPTEVAIRFADRARVPATLTLRGRGSIRMNEELNFDVKLYRPEELTDDVRLGRLFLMAMIEDPHEVELVFGYRLFAKLGLFPLHIQYARVSLNGEPKGMYLLVEPPVVGIRRAHPGTTAIHRRDRENIYRTYWQGPVPGPGDMLSRLKSLNRAKDLSDPVRRYSEVLDLDGYLAWIGSAAILMNQDLLDELFLYEVRDDPERPTPLHLMGWDPEAILSPEPKDDAVEDPLMFSCLGRIDRQIHEHTPLRDRYRRVLRRLLDLDLTIEVLHRTLDEVRTLRDGLDDGMPAADQEQRRIKRARSVEKMKARLVEIHARLDARLREEDG